MSEIRVSIVTRKRKNLFLRYTDPVTGKRHERDSGTKNRRLAERAAGEWQSELNRGTDGHGQLIRWADFRQKYEADHAFNLKENSATDISTVFNVIEATMSPDKLSRISRQWLTRFVNLRIEQGRAAATIEGDLRVLKAALNWAKDHDYVRELPKFPKLKKARKAKVMKGRPITCEEFERIIAVVDSSLKERQHASFRFLLEGLWLSGLRLGEALGLTWDTWADGIRVDTSGEFVVLLIGAEDEKGGKDREYAVTPDFEEFLLAVPEEERVSYVFNPVLHRGVCHRMDSVSKTIVKLGKTAGVKVDEKSKKDQKTGRTTKVTIFASAHDLRRAFGMRWARRVMPMTLKELMRHESVTTTEKYYVGIQAQETARYLRDVIAGPKESPRDSSPK